MSDTDATRRPTLSRDLLAKRPDLVDAIAIGEYLAAGCIIASEMGLGGGEALAFASEWAENYAACRGGR